RISKDITPDEIVRQLVEWPIEIIIDRRVRLVDGDQDFSLRVLILVEREAGPDPDGDVFRNLRDIELLGIVDGLVEDEHEDFEIGIEDEAKPDAGFIEPRPEIGFVRADHPVGRLDLRQVVELEEYFLALESHLI